MRISANYIFRTLIIINTLWFTLSVADSPKKTFTHFTEAQGLPSLMINTIYQDRLGYIWIGTLNGLARYDGYEFKQYTPDPGEYYGANINIVSAIYEDSQDNLWIGYVKGISKFNRIDETFTFFDLSPFAPTDRKELRVSQFCEDKNGRIWIGVTELWRQRILNGLFYLDDTSNTIQQFKTDLDFDIENVLDFIKDENNNLWLSSYQGLFRITEDRKSLKQYNPPNISEPAVMVNLEKDDQGLLWISSLNQGLYRFDLSDESFKQYRFEPSGKQSANNFSFFSLTYDINGHLWLDTNQGLLLFNPETETFELIPADMDNPNSLQTNVISELMTDHSGSVWIGSWDNGLFKYDPGKTTFQSYMQEQINPGDSRRGWVDVIYEDSDEDIWIVLNGAEKNALHLFNRSGESFSSIPFKSEKRINKLYQDKKKTLWIATTGGLYYLNAETSIIEFLPLQIPESDLYIHDLYEDRQGNLWLGTGNGIYILDQDKLDFRHIKFDSSVSGSAATRRVEYFLEDSPGILWAGTNNGLFKIDTKSYKYERSGLGNSSENGLISQDINSIYKDNTGIIWIGTWLGGLTRFDPATNSFRNFTKEDGLVSSAVQGILGDEENNALWLSTFEGISRFDLKTNKFNDYDLSDGIQGKQFADGSYFKTRRGEFIFGGVNGFTIFTSDEVKGNLAPPSVIISDFKLFNKPVKPGENSPLKQPIYDAEEIILDHDENDISFDFLAMFFINPAKNQYAYMLKNFEEDWRYVGSQRTAVYPNLPPGNYTFKVKSANSDDIWSEEEASIKITILSPWWKTIWAYVGYVLFVIGMVFVIDRVQRRRLLARERNAAVLREANLRAQIAESENERKSKELEEARKLQLSMLPKELPQLAQLEISVYMKTASEVGGDYYDFNLADDGTLAAALGDATGHGMQAGTVVTLMKGLFTSDVARIDMESFFNQSSKTIKRIRMGRLMMAFSLLQIKENNVMISSAGMPPVYIFSKESGEVEEILLKGMPLGAIKDFQYTITERELNTGDTILMLSDGLAEQKNDQGEMFDYERIQNIFQKTAHHPPDDIIKQLVNAGNKWMNGQEQVDDISLLVLKFK